MLEAYATAFKEALIDTDRTKAHTTIGEADRGGAKPEDIVFRIIIPSLHAIMDSEEAQRTTSIAQHFMTAQIVMEVLDATMAKMEKPPEYAGRVVLGTSFGDVHGLGKRIVAGCLHALLIEVIDLGVNIPAERFVSEAVARDADVIGISSMMVHTALGPRGSLGVRKLLRERRLEQRIKIAVGGAAYRFDRNLYASVEADGWADNGIAAGQIILDLIREVRR